jgi:hypothetical protein
MSFSVSRAVKAASFATSAVVAGFHMLADDPAGRTGSGYYYEACWFV